MTAEDPGVISLADARERMVRAFRFLAEAARRREPQRLTWRDYEWSLPLWELPDHPVIERLFLDPESAVFLRVGRADEIPCPPPPPELRDWLRGGWESPSTRDPSVLPIRVERLRVGEGEANNGAPPSGWPAASADGWHEKFGEVRFDTDPARIAALAEWSTVRSTWRETAHPAWAARQLFERLFALKGRFDRESERTTLFLGFGLLRVSAPAGKVDHPLLVQRCELRFDPRVPHFEIVSSDEPVALATAQLRDLGVDGRALANLRSAVSSKLMKVGDSESRAFLLDAAHTLFADARVLSRDEVKAAQPDSTPIVVEQLVAFASSRSGRVRDAMDEMAERLSIAASLPGPLQALLLAATVEDDPSRITPTDDHPSGGPAGQSLASGVPQAQSTSWFGNPLFTKPANNEQAEIVAAMVEHGAVAVQGPPGTGKTHTIANLIGHLLAIGKSVLVTSHSTKALRVLRTQVVPELRPLCVSVLDRDAENTAQLEESVKGIVSYLSIPASTYSRDAEALTQRRASLLGKIDEVDRKLLTAVRAQYDPLVLDGRSWTPSEAARIVSAERRHAAWIPGPLEPGAGLPLAEAEVMRLYRSNAELPTAVEALLRSRLPDIKALPSVDEFNAAVERLRRCREAVSVHDSGVWTKVTCERAAATRALEVVEAAFALIDDDAGYVALVDESWRDGPRAQVWREFAAYLENTAAEIEELEAAIAIQAPTYEGPWPVNRRRDVVAEIIVHLSAGKSLGRLALALHRDWKELISSSIVADQPPSTLEDFQALDVAFDIEARRSELLRRWRVQADVLGWATAEELGARPEQSAEQWAQRIAAAIQWREQAWNPVAEAFAELGFDWKKSLLTVAPRPGPEVLRLRDAAIERWPVLIEAKLSTNELAATQDRVRRWQSALLAADQTDAVQRVADAVRREDLDNYAVSYAILVDVIGRQALKQDREVLLTRLECAAPAWAGAVRSRLSPHDRSEPPERDVAACWRVRQLEEELRRREDLDPAQLQSDLTGLREDLLETTRRLAKALAWGHQHKRVSPQMQAALTGWYKTVTTRGFNTGKRAVELQSNARRLLADARPAVPVWIMPLSRVYESYSFRDASFDVVIVDESSQCDFFGLAAVGLAKQVIIVGDDKQVSPAAVGEGLDWVATLIGEYLHGIANSHLYTGRISLYDIAMFGLRRTIRLTEHFRSVAEIIQFSNRLSYAGEIKPLRESNAVATRPFTVAQQVRDGRRVDGAKVNHREADEIASLISAVCEQPEYSGRSIGVISMVGDEQAMLVEEKLRKRLSPTDYETRRVLCGAAAHFQGDERDIVFLSLVDDGLDGPLRNNATNEDLQKRYNVAASRARDQLWVVHSMDPDVDLKGDDLRRRLILHARDPHAASAEAADAKARAESEFERMVIGRLVENGYRVRPQWQVGAFRIDIVVVGAEEQKIAIECDGDRFHPPENLPADLARQRILERLGWRFIRVRGSEFFRAPDETMARLRSRLAGLGIQPIGPAVVGAEEGDPLLDRVRRRAQEILRHWTEMEAAAAISVEDSTGDGERSPVEAEDLDSFAPPEGNGSQLANRPPVIDDVNDAVAVIQRCLGAASFPLGRAQILRITGVTEATWTVAIKKLVESGDVLKEGERRGTLYRAARSR